MFEVYNLSLMLAEHRSVTNVATKWKLGQKPQLNCLTVNCVTTMTHKKWGLQSLYLRGLKQTCENKG